MNAVFSNEHLMYTKLPNVVIGFHGCDKTVFNKILYDHDPFKSSENDYDWLGHGMYFWEQNLERAWQWAKCGLTNPKLKIKTPAVIGAVIDLGNCLNLLDSRNIQILKNQYEIFVEEMKLTGKKLPNNMNRSGNSDLLLRYLDCVSLNIYIRNIRNLLTR